ncbi:MAG: hypothetical protein GY805_14025 [Chloroflexi bacterium]|nr:hypothetical protein [Chloroflexota bacterium]
MTQENQPGKTKLRKRLFYTLISFLFLLLGILIINWTAQDKQLNEVSRGQTAVSHTPTSIISNRTRSPILLATILPATPEPTPTFAPTPIPQLSNSANINLIGPPSNSNFTQNNLVSFYWTYSEEQQPGQQFVLILQQNGQEMLLGKLTEPNLGSGYQLMIDLGNVAVSGTAVWQVRLQWSSGEQRLIAAERSLTISSE